MNSIRPLVTITILVVVCAFLYVKINQGPVRPLPGDSDPWQNQMPEGVPPLAVTTGTTPPSGSTAPPAPPWSANTPSSEASSSSSPEASSPAIDASTDVAATANAGTQQQPAAPAAPVVPPIPDLPEVAPTPQAAETTSAATVPLPAELPANIPTARYPGEPAPNGTTTSADAAASGAPSTAATLPAAEPATPATPTVQHPTTPEQANALDVAAANLSSPPLAAEQNPLRQSPMPAEGDRYATAATPTQPAQVETPAPEQASSFATSWPTIQAALDQGELAHAHELLSRWYDDPTLTPTDAELVDKLLSQLAGTVVYSTEHQLEPPYMVKPGETLETIAQQYDVPWQLLAKINGIRAADQVQPGQELKVVRGPFSAVVDLGRKQLTLMVGDRYAGKFTVTVPSAAAVNEGQWLVDQKTVAPSTSVAQSAYTPAPAVVDRLIVLRGEPTAGQAVAGATLTIGSGGTPANATATPPAIRVSAQDAGELSDILSIGSRVVIRR